MASRYAVEKLDCSWNLVAILTEAGCAIGEFLIPNNFILPTSPSIPLRARFVHIWGMTPLT